MKYLVFTFDGYGLPIAHQLQREGRDVIVAQVQSQDDVISEIERGLDPEDEEERSRRLSLYDGLLEKTTEQEALRLLQGIRDPKEWFIFFDLNHHFKFAEQVQCLGFHGNFPQEDDYLLEIDRERAKDFVAENYPNVRVGRKHRFEKAKEAEAFLNETDDLWVLKGLEEEARTVVPDVDDLDLAKGQILDALKQNPDEYESAGFILELLIPGAMELTPQKVYYDGEPVSTMMCIENKPIGAGNVGPMTDCAQDLVFWTDLDDKINRIAFPPVVDEMARQHRGLFFWDASLLIDRRSGHIFFGEFCANRPGYNALYVQSTLAGGSARLFESYAAGKNPYPENAVSLSTRIFNLFRDGRGRPTECATIDYKGRIEDGLWLKDVRKEGERLVTVGYSDTVGVVTGAGQSVAEAARRAYRHLDQFSFEGAYYRPQFDLVSRDYKNSIVNRIEYGLRRGFYTIGFGLE
jgi:hypothetical protein